MNNGYNGPTGRRMSRMQRTGLSAAVSFLAFFMTVVVTYGAVDTGSTRRGAIHQETRCLPSAALNDEEGIPDDAKADAHYLLGVCYLEQSNFSGARREFSAAVKHAPDYSGRIAREYKKTADAYLKAGETAMIRSLYYTAVQYDDSLKEDIAQKLFAAGREKRSNELLYLSTLYDERLRGKIARHYHALSSDASAEESLVLLKIADRYGSGMYKEEISQKAVALCNSMASPGEREQCMVKNMQYIDDKELFDSALDYYTKLWGEPEKIFLDNDEWVSIMEVHEGDVIHHLSTETVWKKGDDGTPDLLKPASLKPDILTVDQAGMKEGSSMPILLRKYKYDGATYLWIEKNLRNVDMKQRGLR
jgi:tetratricopeptide (TPR) repeat protein